MQAAEEETTSPGKKPVKTKINQNVVVREREFKSTSTHQDKVTGIAYVNEAEFLTSSMD